MKLKEHVKISIRALKMIMKLEKTFTLCLIFGSLLSAASPYVPIYFSAKLIDALFEGAPVSTLALYVALTVGISFFLSLIKRLISSVRSRASSAMYRNESWMYAEKAMSMSYESIEDTEIKLLLERIKKETQTGFNRFYLYQCVERYISSVTKIIASVSLTASFFALESIPLYMKLLLAAGIACTVVYEIFFAKKSNAIRSETYGMCVDANVLSAKYDEYVGDYGAGKDVRLYGMEEHLASTMAKNDKEIYDIFLKGDVKSALLSVPDTLLNDGLKLGTYLILIFAALSGSVSVGSIAKYVSCIMMLIDAVFTLVRTFGTSFENHKYLKRYFSYFDIPNNMYKGSLTVEKRDDNEYYVEFRDVSFRYPNTERYALRHVNIKFKVGEKLAVVGMNGSGKTTFIKLLCRLYDPTEGEILLNGVNIKKYDYDEYISIFSVVFQDFRLFAFTLGQNTAAANTYDREFALECLEKAGLSERLKTMPDGIDTYQGKYLSDRGVEISGGERQKLALARALYKNAPFIILDEPTSALDPVSEYEVYSNFNLISGDKTTVYISHRLASCRFFDKIAVFDNGSIVQTGSHEALVADEGGKYHELWHAQAQYYSS